MDSKTAKRLSRHLATFKHPFEVKPGFVDMRGMSKNYATGVIPWKDLSDILDIVIGPPPAQPGTVDPRTQENYTIDLCWRSFDEFGILSEIQRDMIPSHVYGLETDFDGRKISVVLAMEDPVTGKTCPFDGHHTSREIYRQGWTVCPVAVLRAPKEMIEADPQKAREYLMRVAGEAFLSINLTHKKPVGGYDKFIIMRDYGDPETVEIDNILKQNNCQAVRIARDPGDISHYPFLLSAYKLESNFTKGLYLDKALAFHRYCWPAEQVYGATLIGLANFFQKCDKSGISVDKEFVDDLAKALKGSYRLSKFTHLGYKEAYELANPFGSASDEIIVTCGFAHTYNKHVGKQKLYRPELQFTVK